MLKVRQFFVDNGIFEMEWPGNSPDLNPIEHLWYAIKVKIAKEKPSNKNELKEVKRKVWNNEISIDYLETLVKSMPQRLKAVIKAKGGATKY